MDIETRPAMCDGLEANLLEVATAAKPPVDPSIRVAIESPDQKGHRVPKAFRSPDVGRVFGGVGLFGCATWDLTIPGELAGCQDSLWISRLKKFKTLPPEPWVEGERLSPPGSGCLQAVQMAYSFLQLVTVACNSDGIFNLVRLIPRKPVATLGGFAVTRSAPVTRS